MEDGSPVTDCRAGSYGFSRLGRGIALILALTLASTSCVLLKTDERIDVVAAAKDLSAGTNITEKDITIIAMPVSEVTQDMPRKSSQVVGHTTKVAISRGKLILLSEVK